MHRGPAREVAQHGGATVGGELRREVAQRAGRRAPCVALPPAPVGEVDLDQPPRRPRRVAGTDDQQPGPPAVGQHHRADRLPAHVRAPEHVTNGTLGVDRAQPDPRLVGAGGEDHGVRRRPGGGLPALPALLRLLDDARWIRRIDRPAEDPAGALVADEDRPAAVGEATDGSLPTDAHRADDPSVLCERGQERVPRLRGVPETEPLRSQQVRQVQRLGGPGQRREPVPVGDERGAVGHRRGAVGRALGTYGQESGDQSDHDDAGQPGGQPPQPPPPAGLGPGPLLRGPELRVGADLRRLEELALPGGQLVDRAGGPVEGRAQPGAAVQLVVRAAAALPLLRGRRQVPADGAPGGVVLQPPGQARPSGQQRFVRDVEPLAVEGQQPPRHEAVDHRPAHGASITVQVELGERDRASDERPALVGVGQPDEQAPGGLPALLVERCPGRLRRPAQ